MLSDGLPRHDGGPVSLTNSGIDEEILKTAPSMRK